MRHLFTPDGERALRAVMARAPLLAFDFDGTLAPIVQHPRDARIAPDEAALLARLARHRPVAIVTGRSVDDVRARLGFVPAWVVGSHGAEDPHAAGDGERLVRALDTARARIAAHRDELVRLGVAIEDKGHSLALHYRRAPDPAATARCIDRVLDGLGEGVSVFGGKCVANVVPADAPDKGDAVVALAGRAGAGAVVFAGDDVNDEAVFERAEPHWLTVRVGRADEGTSSAAAWFLRDQAEVAAMLRRMLVLLDGPTPA